MIVNEGRLDLVITAKSTPSWFHLIHQSPKNITYLQVARFHFILTLILAHLTLGLFLLY